jgi:hypothetical protein
MAIIGQGVQAGLGRVDYTPYLQGAMAGAQGIAQGIAGVGKSAADAIQEYQKNKLANDVLQGRNVRMLAILSKNPNYADFAPEKDTIAKLSEKLTKGGLSLSDNKKLNAELTTAFEIGGEIIKVQQQERYAKAAEAQANAAAFELDRKKKESAAIDLFGQELAKASSAAGGKPLDADTIIKIGVGAQAPFNVINAAAGGSIEADRINLAKSQFETDKKLAGLKARGMEIENEEKTRIAGILKSMGTEAKIESVDVNGTPFVRIFDPVSGKSQFEQVKLAKVNPDRAQQIQNFALRYLEAEASGNQAGMTGALGDFAVAMKYPGGFTLSAVMDDFKPVLDNARQNLAAGRVPSVPLGQGAPAGATSIRRVDATPQGQTPQKAAPTPAQSSNVQAVRTSTGVVAQNNLPPKLPTANTEQLGASGNADLQAFLANASVFPSVNDTQLTQAVIAAAPQAPVVDTNIEPSRLAYIPRSPAGAPQYGTIEQERRFNFPAMSIAGAAERSAAGAEGMAAYGMAPRSEFGTPDFGKFLGLPLRGAEALARGIAVGDYTVPEQSFLTRAGEGIGTMLSGSNSIGETARAFTVPFGGVPEGVGEAVFDRPSNAIQATMEALSSGMRPGGGRQQTSEAAAPRPMQSAEIPRIELSKDAKRIADLLLQEYENTKGGKPPTFTITASRPGGGETTVKLRNPEILAIMSNPTNFGGLIRGNVNQFQQQNAQMNRILEQMLAERQAAQAARRANRAR